MMSSEEQGLDENKRVIKISFVLHKKGQTANQNKSHHVSKPTYSSKKFSTALLASDLVNEYPDGDICQLWYSIYDDMHDGLIINESVFPAYKIVPLLALRQTIPISSKKFQMTQGRLNRKYYAINNDVPHRM